MITRLRTILFRSSSGLSFLGNAANAFLGFFTFFLLARLLSPAELGIWVIFVSGTVFLDMLRYGLVQNGLIKFYSGAGRETQSQVEGAGLLIHVTTTALLAVVVAAIHAFAPAGIADSIFKPFLVWYPLYAFVSLPHAFAEWLSQARDRFDRMLAIRLAVRLPFVLFLLAGFMIHPSVTQSIVAYCVINVAASLLVIASGWITPGSILKTRLRSVKELAGFGKFSAWTVVGANLLRASDTFLIGHFLGPAATALYAVPMKLLELIEMPIRSMGAATFPLMSRYSGTGNMRALKRLFIRNVGTATLVLFPIVLAFFVFAEPLTVLFGGRHYSNAAIIVRILSAYCLLIPFDRYTGIALDSIGKPGLNALKVWSMLVVNIIGDLAAIKFLGVVWGVAAASIATFAFGSLLNTLILRSQLGVTLPFALYLRFARKTLTGILRRRQHAPRTYQGPSPVSLAFRAACFKVLCATGMPALARLATRKRLRVIVFHSIAASRERAQTNRFLHSHAGVFEKQIRHLARHYMPLTAGEFLSSYRSRNNPERNRVFVTFDDGFKNTAAVAAPILIRHNVPFMTAIISRVADGDYVPWDVRITLAVSRLRATGTPEHSPSSFASLATRFIRNGHEVRRELLERLQQESGLRWNVDEVRTYDPELLGMTWNEVRELANLPGTSFAGHTMSHAVLNRYSDADIVREAVCSREALERELGAAPEFFVYPTGVVDPRIQSCIRTAGFSVAFSLKHRFISPEDDPLDLGRIGIPPHASYEEFVCRVSGLLMAPVALKKGFIRIADALKAFVRPAGSGSIAAEKAIAQ